MASCVRQGYGSEPLRGLLYQRPRENVRVHWDEQCIAEHDKERGTRQKIDEPDTPFVRSPESSEDEAEVSKPARRVQVQLDEAPSDDEEKKSSSPLSPDAMATLTDRLSHWVDIGSPQRRDSKSDDERSTQKGSVPLCVEAARRCDAPRVSLPQGEGKTSSSNFKAQRAKHYNEFAAVKAFQKNFESSDDSETSDEEVLRKAAKAKAKAGAQPTRKSTVKNSDGSD